MAKTKVDQQTIADKLNLSRSTVTKILNHDPVYRVSPETRELILRTADELGYRPRRRRTNNIAYVVCGNMSASEHELYQCICTEAAQHQHRVFMVHLREMPSYRELSLYVNPLAADGALMVGTFSDSLPLQLSGIMPTVVVGSNPRIPGMDQVSVDLPALGYALTQKLIECGHRTIAVVLNDVSSYLWSNALKGYESALADAGIPFDPTLIWEKERRLYPELLKEMFDHDPRPTGLLAWTVMDHPVILSTLMAMGWAVPADLSYVGWSVAEQSSVKPFPHVTSLDGYFESAARVSVRRLMNRIEDRGLPEEETVAPVDVRKGDTCIPVKGGGVLLIR